MMAVLIFCKNIIGVWRDWRDREYVPYGMSPRSRRHIDQPWA